MKRSLNTASLMFVLLMLNFFTAPQRTYSLSEPAKECQAIQTVQFCELTSDPARYIDKPVRTSAIFLTHFPDVWFMYDENCNVDGNRVTNYINCKSDAECDRLRKLSSLHRDGDGEQWRNRMVVVGEIYIVKRQTKSGDPIQVLKFGIRDIELVSAVPSSVPWP